MSSRQNKGKDKTGEPAKDKQRKKDDPKTDDVGLGLQLDDTLSPPGEQTAPVSSGADRLDVLTVMSALREGFSDMTKVVSQDMKSCLDAIHSSVDRHLTQPVDPRSATETESRKRKPPDSVTDGCRKSRKRGRAHEISCSEGSESDGYDSLSLPSLSSSYSRAESTFTADRFRSPLQAVDPDLAQATPTPTPSTSGARGPDHPVKSIFAARAQEKVQATDLGEQVDSNLADIVNDHYECPISSELFAKFREELKRPENCEWLQAPEIPESIWRRLPAEYKAFDKTLKHIQDLLCVVGSGIAIAMEKVGNDDTTGGVDVLIQASACLGRITRTVINSKRKEKLKHKLPEDFKTLAAGPSAPTALLGDVSEKLKKINETERVTLQMDKIWGGRSQDRGRNSYNYRRNFNRAGRGAYRSRTGHDRRDHVVRDRDKRDRDRFETSDRPRQRDFRRGSYSRR